ncbi:hypothetical protein ATZ33_09050 [Enterococcus silesiacus]|nr:TetR family transcriptional regulator [Enterococcus silesiacus]ALS01509.1 hypothetical protein ATZ33_09050 [Enterococcus silesiacus]
MNKDLRVIKTEELIQKSLIFLLQQQSIEKLTVKDICAYAKIGRSTFYAHYMDKFDVLEKIIKTYSDSFDKLIQQRFSKNEVSESIQSIAKDITKKKTEIQTLFNSPYNHYNLEKSFLLILRKHCALYIETSSKYKQFNLPLTFMIDLYTSSAMTMIHYSLNNELSDNIFDFLQYLSDYGLKKA